MLPETTEPELISGGCWTGRVHRTSHSRRSSSHSVLLDGAPFSQLEYNGLETSWPEAQS